MTHQLLHTQPTTQQEQRAAHLFPCRLLRPALCGVRSSESLGLRRRRASVNAPLDHDKFCSQYFARDGSDTDEALASEGGVADGSGAAVFES